MRKTNNTAQTISKEQATKALQADLEARMQACNQDIQQVLQKYGMRMQVNPQLSITPDGMIRMSPMIQLAPTE